MKQTSVWKLILCCLGLAVFLLAAPEKGRAAEAAKSEIILPKAETSGGKPLMEALSLRQATRKFSARPLSEQDLSNLLWAAWGINRPDGRHTAPTAKNRQTPLVYVAMESGVWLYEPEGQRLKLQMASDTRSRFGDAPVTLLYADKVNDDFSAMHVGSLYQNVGLYCASAGLGNVVKRSGVDALDGELKLPKGYGVFMVQSIGWPE